jgi:hypothetical protein
MLEYIYFLYQYQHVKLKKISQHQKSHKFHFIDLACQFPLAHLTKAKGEICTRFSIYCKQRFLPLLVIMMMLVVLKALPMIFVAFNFKVATYMCDCLETFCFLLQIPNHIHEASSRLNFEGKCLRHMRARERAYQKYSISKPIILDTFIFDIFTLRYSTN